VLRNVPRVLKEKSQITTAQLARTTIVLVSTTMHVCKPSQRGEHLTPVLEAPSTAIFILWRWPVAQSLVGNAQTTRVQQLTPVHRARAQARGVGGCRVRQILRLCLANTALQVMPLRRFYQRTILTRVCNCCNADNSPCAGQYQDEEGQESCKSCPAGQSSERPGQAEVAEEQDESSDAAIVWGRRLQRGSQCVDDDACLQAKPTWGASYNCAGSTQYCTSYASDMATCCPESCGKCSDDEVPDRSSCEYCAVGKLAPILHRCQFCDSANQIPCVGQHQDEEGQESCKSCPAGQYSEGQGQAEVAEEQDESSGAASVWGRRLQRGSQCVDDDACLQNSPDIRWSSYTCAGSIQYCISLAYADVMACCPESCGKCTGEVCAACARGRFAAATGSSSCELCAAGV
jgi:hypothetical protein